MSTDPNKRTQHIDFDRVNAAARGALPAMCARWLAERGLTSGDQD